MHSPALTINVQTSPRKRFVDNVGYFFTFIYFFFLISLIFVDLSVLSETNFSLPFNTINERIKSALGFAIDFQNAHESFNNKYAIILILIGAFATYLGSIVAVTHLRQRRILKTPVADAPDIPRLPSSYQVAGFVLAGTDILLLHGTFLAIAWLANQNAPPGLASYPAPFACYSLMITITLVWFWLLEHYRHRRPFWDELREIVRVVFIMTLLAGASNFITGLSHGCSLYLLVWSANFLLIPIGRTGTRWLLDHLNLWQRSAIILGAGQNAREAYLAIKDERSLGYRVLGFVETECNDRTCAPQAPEAYESMTQSGNESAMTAPWQGTQNERPSVRVGNESFPIFAARKRIDTLIAELGNPYVIVAMDSLVEPGNQKLINHLLATQINLHIVPAIRGLPLFGTKISHFFSHEVIFLTVRNNLAQPGYAWFKRSFDIVVACLLLILLSPLFLLLSFLIRRDGGNAFYGHTRIGRNGRPFQCLKFRSMRMDADKVLQELLARDTGARAEWEKDFKLKNDPRITPVGRFLRKTSLDELPQLINVIKGEMSLVGPRPVVSAELERYGDYARLYLQVLPGITGLWQVSGRNDTSYNERVSLDAWYVQNWSIWYDIAVLFKTINVVLNQRGAY